MENKVKNNTNTIIEQYENVDNNQLTFEFYNSKLKKKFLLTARKSASGKHILTIYDPDADMFKVGEILYTIHKNNKVFLVAVEIDANYQQSGLGRLLFDIASTHGDIFDATKIYGEAAPINNIRGVTETKEDPYRDEVQALHTIYQKLGCIFEPKSHLFSHRWKSGEKIKQASPIVETVAYSLANKEGFSKEPNQPQ